MTEGVVRVLRFANGNFMINDCKVGTVVATANPIQPMWGHIKRFELVMDHICLVVDFYGVELTIGPGELHLLC